MKKLLLLIMLGMLILPMVSAGTTSVFTKDADTKYGKVLLKSHVWIDVFGWFDENLQEIELKENTDSCGSSCYAIKDIQVFKEGALIDSVRFETILKDGSRREEPIIDYDFYIRGIDKQVTDIVNVCTPSKTDFELNGTAKIVCKEEEVTRNETTWNEYDEKVKYKAGNYSIKLTGEKIAKRSVDWLVTSQGKEISEWAVWSTETNIINAHGVTLSSSESGGTARSGMKISVGGESVKLINFSKTGSCTATKGYLLDSGKNILYSTDFIGNLVEWTGGLTLNANTDYYLGVDKVGAAYNSNYANTVYPITGNKVNWTGGLDTAGGDNSGQAFNVIEFQISFINPIDGSVTLNSPNQNSVFNNSAVNFNCSTSGHSVDLANMSLLIQYGTWSVNESVTGLTGTSYSLNTTKRFPNGVYNWTCMACDVDGDCGYPAINRTFTSRSDYIAPTISIHTPTGNQGIKALPYNVTLNYTASDTNLQSCWYNTSLSATLVYTPCNITNITSITSAGTQRIYVYANDSFGNSHTNYTEFYTFMSINNVTYNPTTTQTASETFTINMTKSPTITSVNVFLNYSGTLYAATSSTTGNQVISTATITIPSNANLINNFTWVILAYEGTTLTTVASSLYSQSVSALTIYSCNTGNGLALNFTTYDIANLQRKNASLEATMSYYVSGGGISNSTTIFSDLLENKSNWMFCINNTNLNATIDATVSYFATGYDRREYLISGGVVGNFTQNIPLYLAATNVTDVVTIRVVDQNYNVLSGALVNIQQWNIGTNTYPSVGMLTTSSEGQGIINLELYNVWYRAIVTYEGEIVEVTEVQKLGSTTWQIIVNLGISNIFDVYGDISHGLTWNNATNITEFVWVDSSGYLQQGCLDVQNLTNLGYQSVYNSCLTTNAGIINYQINDYNLHNYWVRGTIDLTSTSGNATKIVDELFIGEPISDATKIVSPFGRILSFMLIGTAALIGVTAGSPLYGVFTLGVAMFACIKLGWLNMSMGVFWGFIALFIIILFRLTRRTG